MWDFFETVRHRHSVRIYQQDMPVDEARLHAILEMACAAPSAGDLQAYRIVVVRDADERRALSVAADNQGFIAEAPVCLVFCADPARSASTFGERGAKLRLRKKVIRRIRYLKRQRSRNRYQMQTVKQFARLRKSLARPALSLRKTIQSMPTSQRQTRR